LSPLLSGVYAGAKADSFGQGARGFGSSLLGHGLGGIAGGLGGYGLGRLLGADELHQQVMPTQIGTLVGQLLGGGAMAHRSATKYNSKLERYRKHQKDLAGGATVNVYNADNKREAPREEEEKAAGWMQNLGRRATRAPGAPPRLPLGNQIKGRLGAIKAPLIAGATGLGVGGAAGYGKGNIDGQLAGATKATNYFENMPAWQHMLMGMAGLVGQQGALVDYGLGRAHKKQQQGGFWERMVGPDYLDLQSRTRDMRKANPNPMQQRIASWFR
jgi:hypothetical protein